MLIFLLIHWLLLLFPEPADHLLPGDRLPSCAFRNASGEMVYTDSLRGHIVVLDIWASWNLPSRSHNLQLIKLYEKYRVLNIRKKHQVCFLSISMDTQRDFWLVARAKDDLHWPYNICDFKGWDSETLDSLDLHIIPANFIVDANGTIVARNLWGPVLDSTLKELNKQVPN